MRGGGREFDACSVVGIVTRLQAAQTGVRIPEESFLFSSNRPDLLRTHPASHPTRDDIFSRSTAAEARR